MIICLNSIFAVQCNGLHVVNRSNIGWKSIGVKRCARMLRGRDSGTGQFIQRSYNTLKEPVIKPQKNLLSHTHTYTHTLPTVKAVSLQPPSTDWHVDGSLTEALPRAPIVTLSVNHATVKNSRHCTGLLVIQLQGDSLQGGHRGQQALFAALSELIRRMI